VVWEGCGVRMVVDCSNRAFFNAMRTKFLTKRTSAPFSTANSMTFEDSCKTILFLKFAQLEVRDRLFDELPWLFD
jgi:hypothetical protein